MEMIEHLESRRREVLQQMEAIRSMERAALSEQMLRVKHQGTREPVLRGPYYVLSWWAEGKSHSRRVPKAELEQVRLDVANHERFAQLCEEFEELTVQLGRLEREEDASGEALKKKSRPRSRKAGKSTG